MSKKISVTAGFNNSLRNLRIADRTEILNAMEDVIHNFTIGSSCEEVLFKTLGSSIKVFVIFTNEKKFPIFYRVNQNNLIFLRFILPPIIQRAQSSEISRDDNIYSYNYEREDLQLPLRNSDETIGFPKIAYEPTVTAAVTSNDFE